MDRLQSKFVHYIKTPLIKGEIVNGIQFYYKYDNLQPSGSFKDRGIGHMIHYLTTKSGVQHLLTSSGGNAGHSVACIGQRLKIPVTCFVPKTTLPMMIEKIKSRGTNVIIEGNNWNEADAKAKELLSTDNRYGYIPPFDNPLIFEGNSTIVDEIKEDLNDIPPDAIAVSVGGGGLLAGIQKGIERYNWNKRTKIYGLETIGAASFSAAKKEGKVVKLEKIDTIASTLGALAVTAATLNTNVTTDSIVVSDSDAVKACLNFANNHRMLVEPACGASLSILNEKNISLLKMNGIQSVVVIVCGGSAVDLNLLEFWKKKFDIK